MFDCYVLQFKVINRSIVTIPEDCVSSRGYVINKFLAKLTCFTHYLIQTVISIAEVNVLCIYLKVQFITF